MAVRKKYISITVEKLLNQYNIEAPPVNIQELAGALGITIEQKKVHYRSRNRTFSAT